MLFITYDAKVSIEQPSRRLVFNDISSTCDSYRDSSPAAKNDDGVGRESRNALASPLGGKGTGFVGERSDLKIQ